MIDRVILAMRASPGWELLARDYEAGIPVPPSRFFPAHDLRFSRDIPALIERWNFLSPISYFACRQRLRQIASDNLSLVIDVDLVDWRQVPALVGTLDEESTLLFYHDDDDWFRPDLKDAVAGIDIEDADAVVFPFLRLASNMTTFTRDGERVAGAIGNFEPFRYRYCTNNYGLTARALKGSARLVEHTCASEEADALAFVDVHSKTLVSATSKSPCSASWLPKLPETRSDFRAYIRHYIDVIERIEVPAEAEWIRQPLSATLELFRTICRE